MTLDPNRWTLKTTEAFSAATEAARAASHPEVTPDHLLVALLEEIKRSSFRQIRDQGDVNDLISELDGLNFSPGVPTPRDQA